MKPFYFFLSITLLFISCKGELSEIGRQHPAPGPHSHLLKKETIVDQPIYEFSSVAKISDQEFYYSGLLNSDENTALPSFESFSFNNIDFDLDFTKLYQLGKMNREGKTIWSLEPGLAIQKVRTLTQGEGVLKNAFIGVGVNDLFAGVILIRNPEDGSPVSFFRLDEANYFSMFTDFDIIPTDHPNLITIAACGWFADNTTTDWGVPFGFIAILKIDKNTGEFFSHEILTGQDSDGLYPHANKYPQSIVVDPDPSKKIVYVSGIPGPGGSGIVRTYASPSAYRYFWIFDYENHQIIKEHIEGENDFSNAPLGGLQIHDNHLLLPGMYKATPSSNYLEPTVSSFSINDLRLNWRKTSPLDVIDLAELDREVEIDFSFTRQSIAFKDKLYLLGNQYYNQLDGFSFSDNRLEYETEDPPSFFNGFISKYNTTSGNIEGEYLFSAFENRLLSFQTGLLIDDNQTLLILGVSADPALFPYPSAKGWLGEIDLNSL